MRIRKMLILVSTDEESADILTGGLRKLLKGQFAKECIKIIRKEGNVVALETFGDHERIFYRLKPSDGGTLMLLVTNDPNCSPEPNRIDMRWLVSLYFH